MAGSGALAPLGRTIRTDTSPAGPPGILRSWVSTSGLSIGEDRTSSTVARPFSGPRSKRYGGLAVASANSLASFSRCTGRDLLLPVSLASRCSRLPEGDDAGDPH